MDVDQDGTLTRREYLHKPQDAIENIATGALSRNDLLEGNADARNILFGVFDRADSDHDGRVSLEEWRGGK